MSSPNRLRSRSGDNSGIVNVYLPGLVIEHSCLFFDNYRHSKVYSIILVYISLERIAAEIVKYDMKGFFFRMAIDFFIGLKGVRLSPIL